MSIKLAENVIKKLDFIDSCRKRLSIEQNERLKLPQIIAVGDQSSGKSSILEAISGIKLPKGTDTVTIRPIVVHMRRKEVEECTIKCGSETYNVRMADVERKIREVQGHQVIKDPIYVDVFSPNVPPLTIIDLPGIVKQAVKNQKESIVSDTKSVSSYYMSQENSLILCVIPATSDFSTVDTLTLASECDIGNRRTIGVLTKMDNVVSNEINSKVDILKNISKPLTKGYYGLILSDSILSLDHKDREVKEKEEFLKKGNLWEECNKYLGLQNFTNKLVTELVALIDLRLPELRVKMSELLKEAESDIGALEGIFSHQPSQRKHLIEMKDLILKKLEDALLKGNCKLMDYKNCGDYLKEVKILTEDVEKYDTFLYGHHKIFQSLVNQFTKFFKENFKLSKSPYNMKYLQGLAEKCSTEHIPIFLSSEPFKEIVKLHLYEYEEQSLYSLLICTEMTSRFMDNMINENTCFKIQGLKEVFKEQCSYKLKEQNNIATERIRIIFRSELRCFTQRNLTTMKEEKELPNEAGSMKGSESSNMNLNKMTNSTSMSAISLPKPKDGDSVSLNEKNDTKYSGKKLKETLEEYIQNLIFRLGDVIPNIIMLTLFEEFHGQLQSSLNTFITSDDVMEYFKNEGEEERIKKLSEDRDALERSLRDLTTLLK